MSMAEATRWKLGLERARVLSGDQRGGGSGQSGAMLIVGVVAVIRVQ